MIVSKTGWMLAPLLGFGLVAVQAAPSLSGPYSAAPLTARAGAPPDAGEVLTEVDRVAILADLLLRACESRGVTAILDVGLEELKEANAIPQRLTVLNEKDLLRRSRLRSYRRSGIEVVKLGELRTIGDAVYASFGVSLAYRGEYSLMCCYGKTYVYRRVDGQWKGELGSGYEV